MSDQHIIALLAQVKERRKELAKALPPGFPELVQLTALVNILSTHVPVLIEAPANDEFGGSDSTPREEYPAVAVAPTTRGSEALHESLLSLLRVADALPLLHNAHTAMADESKRKDRAHGDRGTISRRVSSSKINRQNSRIPSASKLMSTLAQADAAAAATAATATTRPVYSDESSSTLDAKLAARSRSSPLRMRSLAPTQGNSNPSDPTSRRPLRRRGTPEIGSAEWYGDHGALKVGDHPASKADQTVASRVPRYDRRPLSGPPSNSVSLKRSSANAPETGEPVLETATVAQLLAASRANARADPIVVTRESRFRLLRRRFGGDGLPPKAQQGVIMRDGNKTHDPSFDGKRVHLRGKVGTKAAPKQDGFASRMWNMITANVHQSAHGRFSEDEVAETTRSKQRHAWKDTEQDRVPPKARTNSKHVAVGQHGDRVISSKPLLNRTQTLPTNRNRPEPRLAARTISKTKTGDIRVQLPVKQDGAQDKRRFSGRLTKSSLNLVGSRHEAFHSANIQTRTGRRPSALHRSMSLSRAGSTLTAIFTRERFSSSSKAGDFVVSESAACRKLTTLTTEIHAALNVLRRERSNTAKGLEQLEHVTEGAPMDEYWHVVNLEQQPRPVSILGSSDTLTEVSRALFEEMEDHNEVAADKARVVAAVGPHGTGKGAAFEILTTSGTGLTYFSDGVVWLCVKNKQPTLREVVSLIDDAQCKTVVPSKRSSAIADGRDPAVSLHEEARNRLRVAQRHFANRRVAIVLDGSWPISQGFIGCFEAPAHSDTAPIQHDFADIPEVFRAILALAHPSSRVLICTTNAAIASRATRVPGDQIVYIPSQVSTEAASNLFKSLSASNAPMSRMLKVAAGIPLAVTILARVAQLAGEEATVRYMAGDAVGSLESTMPSCLSTFDVPMSIAVATEIALDMLDKEVISAEISTCCDVPCQLQYTWREMFMGLCVLPASMPTAPLSFLMRLWRIPRKSAARAVVEAFVTLGLAVYCDGDIVVHPVHHIYCAIAVGRDAPMWHMRVLAQYALTPSAQTNVNPGETALRQDVAALSSKTKSVNDVKGSWSAAFDDVAWKRLCSESCDSGGEMASSERPYDSPGRSGVWYLQSELVRHMVSVPNGLDTAALLLTNYGFLSHKCCTFGVGSLQADYEILLEAAHAPDAMNNVFRESIQDLRDFAELLAYAMSLIPRDVCWRNIGVADSGFANQLLGRLPSDPRRGTLMHRLRESIDRTAARPFLKPHTQHLDQAVDTCERVVRVGVSVSSVAMSDDGGLAACGCADGAVLVHDLRTGCVVREFRGHKAAVLSVSMSRDVVVSTSWHGVVRVWSLATGKCMFILSEHSDQVFCSAITYDNSGAENLILATGSKDRTVVLFRGLSVGASLHILEGHTDWVRCIALSSNGDLVASGADDTTVRIWKSPMSDEVAPNVRSHDWTNVEAEKTRVSCELVLKGHTARVSCVAFTSDDQYIVSGSFDSTIRVWDLMSGDCVCVCKGPRGAKVISLSLPQSGVTIVSGFGDGVTRTWNISTARIISTQSSVTAIGMTTMDVTRDGRWVLTGSFDGALRLYRHGTGRRVRRPGHALQSRLAKPFVSHTRPVSAICVKKDGSRVATGGWDSNIMVWTTAGVCERALSGHAHAIMSLAFAGNYLVSGSRDEFVRVWNLATGACEHTFKHHGPVMTVAVSECGGYVVSGSDDGYVRVWCLETDEGHVVRRCGVPVHSVSVSGQDVRIVSELGKEEVVHVPFLLRIVEDNHSIDDSTFVEKGSAVSTRFSSSPATKYALKVTSTHDESGSSSSDDVASSHSISTFAYLDGVMGRESRLWTPVFADKSGTNFVAAGTSSGRVAIFEIME